MKNTIGTLVVVLCMLCSTFLFAQVPDTLWTRTYGGPNMDYGRSVQQTTDSGYVIAGYTGMYPDCDVYLIKTDASGDTLWTRTYGGTGVDDCFSVQQTTDDGYIVAGSTDSFGAGMNDVYLIKTDASGDTLWTRTYGGTGLDAGLAVQQTTDSGYIVVGVTDSFGAGMIDVYLIKTDASGDILWTRTYGGTSYDDGFSVQQTMDDGYIVAGGTDSFGAGGNDVYLIKTDASGDTLWTRTYGGADDDYGRSVQQTTDSGYVIAGYTGFYLDCDVYLIKTDASGDTLWTRIYGGTGLDAGASVQQTTDNGYIVAGYTDMCPDCDVYLIKTDASGDTLWTRTYGGTGYDVCFSVQQTTDNGYIVAGYTDLFGASDYDVWLLRMSPEPGIEEIEGDVIPDVYVLSQNYPNPFKTETAIHYQLLQPNVVTIAIYNISGQRIKTLVNEPKDAGYYTIYWDGRSGDDRWVNNGVYFCRMVVSEYTSVKKILLMR